MSGSRRVYQVAERIKEIIAEHLVYSADARFQLVTITSVMVSPDLRNCKVYWVVSFVTGVDRQVRISEVEEALSHAAGLFKRILAKQLNIRFVPDIRFYYDDTLDTVEHVEQLMNKIRPAGE